LAWHPSAILKRGGVEMIKNPVRKIVYAGVFIALNIILTRLFSYSVKIGGITGVRLNVGEVPLVLSGILLGPVYGGITGAAADLLGFPINPQGAYFPGFTLSAALMGLVPGLYGKLIKGKWSLLHISLAVIVTTVLTSTVLNTLWVYILSGKAVAVLLPPRITANIVLIPVYIFLISLSLKLFSKIDSRP